MWNPSDEVTGHPHQVYHHQKESAQSYPSQWYSPPEGPESNLVDYSSEMNSDMQHHSRDPERPFKAYPRTPAALPGSFYGSQPAFPTSMAMASVGAERDYPQVTSSCSSVPSGSRVSSMSSLGHTMSQHHQQSHHHGSLHSPTESQTHPSPDSQTHSSTAMMKMNRNSPDNTDHLHSHRVCLETNDSCPDSNSPTSLAPVPSSSQDAMSGSEKTEANGFRVPPKKRPLNVPDTQRDTGYWEKRKKNNESAKRSREARRMKEEQIAMRVVFLEQENLQLRTELSLLKNDIEKLRCMLYNP